MKATATQAVKAASRLIAGLTGVQAIDQLDLGPIKVKLMEEEEGMGWSVEQVNMVEKWYKRFLFLNLQYPSASIVPNKEIDTFWHYHILDTQKYAEDCQNIFGKFFHHFPYFGMRGEADASDLKEAFIETKEIFRSEFGESISQIYEVFPSVSENSSKCKAGNCRSCKGSVCKNIVSISSRPVFVG
ncbi:MAG: hypothetical protein AAB770_01640 [Patescibacteria group bacterium]